MGADSGAGKATGHAGRGRVSVEVPTHARVRIYVRTRALLDLII